MALPLPRQGTASGSNATIIYKRSNRFFRKDGAWFYAMRDGADMGPYADKAEAQMALVYYIEKTEWPTAKELRSYIRAKRS